MFIGTHTFAPVLIATGANLVSVVRFRRRLFTNSDLARIAFCGALPDLLSPHITLSDRLSCWTHTVWFVLAMLPLIVALCYWFHRRGWRALATACWLAMVLHLFCDMIAGGVAPFYPLKGSYGDYYVPPRVWIPLDFVVLAVTAAALVTVAVVERKAMAGGQAPTGDGSTSGD